MPAGETVGQVVGSAIEAVLLGIDSELKTLFEDSLEAWLAFWKAFPNIPKMADIALRWMTSLTGRLVTVPYSGLGELFISRLKPLGYNARLIRLDDAVRLIVTGPKVLLRYATLTDETGIVGLLAGWLARFIYIWTKRIRWLAFLIREPTVETFVAKVVKSLKFKMRFFFWGAVVLGALVLLSAICVLGGLVLFPLGFLNGDSQKLLLPQDSKRKWRRKGGNARINRRRGPDTFRTGVEPSLSRSK